MHLLHLVELLLGELAGLGLPEPLELLPGGVEVGVGRLGVGRILVDYHRNYKKSFPD